MLFMVIERYRSGDAVAVGERFRARGRMMPAGVEYVASWMRPDGSACYQVMEAPSRESLDGWIRNWEDLVAFEVEPVLASADYWRGVPPA